MIFEKQRLEGVFIITPEPFKDKRGMLRRHYCAKELKENGINYDVKQCNVSENKLKCTLRGFHYQSEPYGEDKIISCMNGSIFNVVIDLRKNSKTYLQWESFNLSKGNRKELFVPKGYANAYLTLEENTWIFYYHSEFYSSGSEGGICYNDPFFDIKWPSEPQMISDKDLSYSNFNPNTFLK